MPGPHIAVDLSGTAQLYAEAHVALVSRSETLEKNPELMA